MSKATWVQLNETLRKTTDEKAVLQLFEEEKARKPRRPQFLKRIWARYSKLRARRERKTLVKW